MLAIVAAAVALKVAVVAPAATVTEGGTASDELLLDSVTLEPPIGADCVRVTVHVLVAPPPNAIGEQVNGDRVGTVIVPPPADVKGRPFPIGSTPMSCDI